MRNRKLTQNVLRMMLRSKPRSHRSLSVLVVLQDRRRPRAIAIRPSHHYLVDAISHSPPSTSSWSRSSLQALAVGQGSLSQSSSRGGRRHHLRRPPRASLVPVPGRGLPLAGSDTARPRPGKSILANLLVQVVIVLPLLIRRDLVRGHVTVSVLAVLVAELL